MVHLYFISLVTAFCVFCSKSQTTEGFPIYHNVTDQLPLTCLDVSSSEPRVVTLLRDGLEVLCDTQTDGGGWIVIQRRVNGTINFYRGWEDYKYGFGNIDCDFWFGNEKIHRLTFQRRYELRVDLKFRNHDFYAVYSHFRLYGEPEGYMLKIWGYSGNAGDDLSFHRDQRFSTHDRDNDAARHENCAVSYHGAWWYEHCLSSNLNGLWGSKDYAKGLTWSSTTTAYDSAQFTEMKIRPVYY